MHRLLIVLALSLAFFHASQSAALGLPPGHLLSAEERADATVRERTARHAAAARDRLEYRRDLYGKLLGAMIGSPGEGPMTKPIWYTPR
jgi:hypothetical protein